jgi:hypothetical protein
VEWGASRIPLVQRLLRFPTPRELRFAFWCRKQPANWLKRSVPILSRSGKYNPAMATSSLAGSKPGVDERCEEEVQLGRGLYEFAAGRIRGGLEAPKSPSRRSTGQRWIRLYRSGSWSGRSDETTRSR